jgi:uncharacterized protein (TIGR03083 family)
MSLTTEESLSAITEHSEGLARAARGNLDARVEHCPDWSVADLVWHVTDVHWFWGTICEDRLQEPPVERPRPERPADADLVDRFEAGARRMVEALRAADQQDAVWTWAPGHQDVAFITRHQVQEAAVHHWDAVNAAGGSLAIGPAAASDSVDEFLSVSLSSDADPAEPPRPPLAGTLVLRATDLDTAWTLTDGEAPGTVRTTRTAELGPPTVEATASDLLLWLYKRRDLGLTGEAAGLAARFRALTFTD